ncbi:Crp/Fnr family transcriptional regulator [Aestuariivivens insulae]|uniref:Crp/Fnr family transcriptional regulator n=1 Tax=Aestuariivivens insulae TaxID=1621988 RepID=UPI001F5829AF|nr:cyclic nucleotide-binding domain-containing protein [Aestuariivivens insulae]
MNPISQIIESLNNEYLWDNTVVLNRNDFLAESGTINTNLYWVVEDSFRIYVIEEHEEQTIRFGYKNNLIAALDSFLNEKPTDFYIQALKQSTVKVLNKPKFMDFIRSSSENTKIWQLMLEQFVLQQMERERDILTASPIDRYNRVLKRSPQLFQEIPNKYIASYLRMTPETLSRIKKS